MLENLDSDLLKYVTFSEPVGFLDPDFKNLVPNLFNVESINIDQDLNNLKIIISDWAMVNKLNIL